MRSIHRLSLTSVLLRTMLLLAIAVCAIIGVAGLVLPLVPGILFLCIAGLLLRQLGRT